MPSAPLNKLAPVWYITPTEFNPGKWVLSAMFESGPSQFCAPEGHLGFPSAKAAMTKPESLRFAEEATGLPIVELFSKGLEFEEIG